jgi:uncharacterized protein (TIGR00290 family)
MSATAVLWTGGKDSALALYMAQSTGCEVVLLATFAPPSARFRAHPLALMARQADAMGIRHRVFDIREPMREGYVAALRQLVEEEGISVVVTGDIAEVDANPNWIRECSRGLPVEVRTPLWHREREELLDELIEARFKIVFTCVKKPWFTPEWVGRELDAAAVRDMRALRVNTGLDLCGEQGEYHTMVVNGPAFRSPVEIPPFKVQTCDDLMYLDIGS